MKDAFDLRQSGAPAWGPLYSLSCMRRLIKRAARRLRSSCGPTGLIGTESVMKCPRCSTSRTGLSKFGIRESTVPALFG
jgi:hypothetical protein